ncbi:MAG: sulfite oxidase heme-binding subunit YedZ [Vicinamibacterales bacterium]
MKPIAIVKPVLFAAAAAPAVALAWNAYTGDLTANPVDYITDQTGSWALACLIVSLGVTPFRRLTGWNDVIKVRRMLGLFAFFYATLHMLTWVTLVSFFDVPTMIEDVTMRPFITVGMATFLILLVLAITSNRASIRRLGRRWQTLHRLVYLAGLGGVIHFWWLVKADTTEPQRWAVALAALLGFRAWWTWRTRTLSRF